MKAIKILASASALALAAAGSAVVAQSTLPDVTSELPLSVNCPVPTPTNQTRCTTPIIGSVTSTVRVPITSTPLQTGGFRVTGQVDVAFNGQLQVEGVRLQNNGLAASVLLPGEGPLPTVGATGVYTVNLDQNFVNGVFVANSGMSFSHNSLNVSSINIDISDAQINLPIINADGISVSYSIKSTDPTQIVNNSTPIEGFFRQDGDGGTIVFGKISGTASVEAGTITTTPGGPYNPLSYLSPFGLVLNATPVVTTQLDENGLITPTVTVTDGIEMNGSGIHGLADGVAHDDAATVGQIRSAFNGAGANSVQIGNGSQAVNGASVAIGYGNTASGNGAVAIGDPVVATGQGAVALGYNTTANGEGAVALGSLSQAIGKSAIALGADANAGVAGSIAIGDAAEAIGGSSIALGKNSNAGFSGSTAVGAGASTSRANQMVLGGTGSSVTVGDIVASTTAQSGATDLLTVDATGTLGRDTTIRPAMAALTTVNATQDTRLSAVETVNGTQNTRISAVETVNTTQDNRLSAVDALNLTQTNRLGSLESAQSALTDLVHRDRQDARRGIAAAVALTQAAMPSAPGKTSYVFNLATYRGEQAVGGAIAHRFEGENPFALTLGFSHAGGKNTAARVGVAGEF